jgi:hypothetical protein
MSLMVVHGYFFLFFPIALLLKKITSEFTKLILQSLALFHACVFMLKI